MFILGLIKATFGLNYLDEMEISRKPPRLNKINWDLTVKKAIANGQTLESTEKINEYMYKDQVKKWFKDGSKVVQKWFKSGSKVV